MLHTLGMSDGHSRPSHQPSLLPFRADCPQAFQFNEQMLKSMRSRQRNPESLLMCEVIRMPFQTPPGLTTLAKHKQEKRQALRLRSQASRCFQQLCCWYQNSTSPEAGDTHRVCAVKLRISKAQPAQAGPLPFLTCQYKPRHSVPGPVSSARNRDVIVLYEAWLSRSLPVCSSQIFRKRCGQRVVNHAHQSGVFLGEKTASRMDPLLFYELC